MAKSQTHAGASQRTRRTSHKVERPTQTVESIATEPRFGVRQAIRTQRRFPSPAILLGYFVSAVMSLTGIAVVAGFMMNQGVPQKLRLTFGIVLTLMGAYRFVLTRTKQMQKLREEEEE